MNIKYLLYFVSFNQHHPHTLNLRANIYYILFHSTADPVYVQAHIKKNYTLQRNGPSYCKVEKKGNNGIVEVNVFAFQSYYVFAYNRCKKKIS